MQAKPGSRCPPCSAPLALDRHLDGRGLYPRIGRLLVLVHLCSRRRQAQRQQQLQDREAAPAHAHPRVSNARELCQLVGRLLPQTPCMRWQAGLAPAAAPPPGTGSVVNVHRASRRRDSGSSSARKQRRRGQYGRLPMEPADTRTPLQAIQPHASIQETLTGHVPIAVPRNQLAAALNTGEGEEAHFFFFPPSLSCASRSAAATARSSALCPLPGT